MENARTTTICLSSAASCHLFPANGPASFVNQLPRALVNREDKRFFIRLKSIALTTECENRVRFESGLVRVHIYEVEGQRRGREYARCAGTFDYPPREWTAGGYGLHTFSLSPRLPVRFQTLNSLHVKITDSEDRELDLVTGPPTLIWLEIMDLTRESEFTITCASRQPNLFPGNELARFTVPLPTEIELPDHEVGLANVVFPPRMEEETTATLRVDDQLMTFDLADFSHTSGFLSMAEVRVRVRTRGRLRFGVRREDGRAYIHHVKRPNRADRPIRVAPSPSFTKACGQMLEPRAVTLLPPGKSIVFQGKPNHHLGLPNPVAMLQCNIIKPNIMCGRQAQLLQCVPVVGRRERGTSRMYEPRQLTFHPVMERPFDKIQLEFTNPDGTPRKFINDNPEDGVLLTLLFRQRRKEMTEAK